MIINKTMGIFRKMNLMWIFMGVTPLFLLALYSVRFNSLKVFQILVITTLSYLTLAILHHLKDKTLIFEVIAEYILIAVLVLLISQTLLF